MVGPPCVSLPICDFRESTADLCQAIHGDKQQNERDWVLNEFKTGKSPIMVATDVASRGIGMIRTTPLPLLLLSMYSYLHLLPLTSCDIGASLSCSLHNALRAIRSRFIWSSYTGFLGPILQFATTLVFDSHYSICSLRTVHGTT